MNKSIYKVLRSHSGSIYPMLLVGLAIIFGLSGYVYLKNNHEIIDLETPKLVKQFKEKANQSDRAVTPVEIAITEDGFKPAAVAIAVGQQITFVNQDKNAHRVISYPLATRNQLPELDSENLQPTDSFTYSFEEAGSFTISENISPGKYKAIVVVN